MKLIKKVSRVQVKKCFLITPYLRKFGVAGRYDIEIPSQYKYVSALRKAKGALNTLTEIKLDAKIGHPRLRGKMYNTVQWYIGTISTDEIGVWKGAGGLPVTWTRGNLTQTAKIVKRGLAENSKEIRKRSKRAIPAILAFKKIIENDPYLFPIIIQSGIGLNGRRPFPDAKGIKGYLDDGNMRGIALAIAGNKTLKAYIGVIQEKKKK